MQINLIDTFASNYDHRQEKSEKPDASLRIVAFDTLVKEEAICVCPDVARNVVEGLRNIEAVYYDPWDNSIFSVYFLLELKYCFVFTEKQTYLFLFDSIIEGQNQQECVLLGTTTRNLHIRNLEMKGEHFPMITVKSLVPKEK